MASQIPADERIDELEAEIAERKEELAELYRTRDHEVVDDYELRRSTGETVLLSELFGDHDDLVLVHNMGSQCNYCTMWADGFVGQAPYIEDRAAFVVCSPDEPEVQREFAESRDWSFEMVSAAGTSFVEDMGFAEDGSYTPGVSTFHRDDDGTITRIASRVFGPRDDFNAAWNVFDLLADGVDGWHPDPTLVE